MNENNLIAFEPAITYIHPEYIGLTKTTIIPLSFFEEEYTPRKSNRFAYIAAAAIAALFFISPAININEHSTTSNKYKAGFSLFKNTSGIPAKSISSEDLPTSTMLNDAAKNEISNTKIIMPQAQGLNQRTYYIVVASETSKNGTKALLNKIQKDFPDASALEARSGRHRIYAASFDDKKMAESYLLSFRQDYPKYKDAWLLSQRNK